MDRWDMNSNESKAHLDCLPHGEKKRAIEFGHFPTRQQAFVWRNWGLLSAARLAAVLGTDAGRVEAAAAEMGLPSADGGEEDLWLRRGYVTVIRRNWHLLSYEQLMQLLGWDAERLADTLKEEDFLWNKLGKIKPHCEPLVWRELTPGQRQRTAAIAEIVKTELKAAAGLKKDRSYSFLGTDRRRPPCGSLSNRDRFELRLGYSFSVLYGDPLLEPGDSFFPDSELEAMQSWGVNAVWLQVILYKLYPWDVAPGLSKGWQQRLDTLRDLVARAKRFGIQIFPYLNEPRNLPDAAYHRYPDLQELAGVPYPEHKCTGLCTSTPPIKEFLREAAAHLFREVPDLGGVFTISMSENATHCHSKKRGDECPRCAQRPVADVVAEVNTLIAEGIHSAKPDARVLVWDWGWRGEEFSTLPLEIVDRLPRSVELLSTSGHFMPITVGGAPAHVSDYSISQPGPGEAVKKVWAHARKRGIKVHAKLQINNSWECSTVPYIPVVDRVEQHLQQVREAGACGVHYAWTLGGYLGGNLGLLEATPDEWALALGGETFAPDLRQAWKVLSQAFTEFPFNIRVVYSGPSNAGPANLLFAQPTGYSATMVCFPYDDVDHWRGIYPPDVFESQFIKLADEWIKGVEILHKAEQKKGPLPEPVAEQLLFARALYNIFRSSGDQIRFFHLRNQNDPTAIPEMLNIIDREIITARDQMHVTTIDSRIGYEPTNHYVYRPIDLLEKIINCHYIREQLLA